MYVKLKHEKNFIVEKTEWKYQCPKCGAMGSIITAKGDYIRREISCHHCPNKYIVTSE